MTRARVDGNQAVIVAELREKHYFVVITSMVKNGYPDINVLLPGAVVLFEIKQPGEPLTDAERTFHEHARAINAPVFVIYCTEDALTRIGEVLRGR